MIQSQNLKFNKTKNKFGFTLIELLIVVAILGLLASIVLVGMGGARARARDARRISDLREVQNALELYYSAKGYYPNVADWVGLKNSLTGSDPDIGIRKIPNDPTDNAPYKYAYGANSEHTHYVLSAKLEQDNSALKDSVTNAEANAFGVGGLNCNSASPDFYYCVGL